MLLTVILFQAPLSPAPEIDEDKFFTPNTSPSTSPKQSAESPSTSSTSDKTARAVTFKPHSHSERNAAPPSMASSATSQASDDEYTNYSWSASGSRSDDTHITIASSTNHSKPSATLPPSDWAKDVRWIVPADSTRHKCALMRSNTTVSLSSTSSSSSKHRAGHYRAGSAPRPKRRMSIVREEDGDVEGSDYPSATTSQTENSSVVRDSSSQEPTPPITRHAQTFKEQVQPRRWKSVSSARSSISGASSTASRQTVDVPPLLPHSQSSGYSTLLMPRTVYTPSKHPGRVDSFVDVAKTGIVGTTMSTISVTRHGAETIARRGKRMSLPNILKPSSGSKSFDLPEHLRRSMPSPVSFSNITPPPTKVQGHQVLVQVWCVALEGLDVLLTRDRAKTPDGYGFVPGRGFLGKAMECGSSVSNIRRGDWVMGVLDVGKVRYERLWTMFLLTGRVLYSAVLSRNSSWSIRNGSLDRQHQVHSVWNSSQSLRSPVSPLTEQYRQFQGRCTVAACSYYRRTMALEHSFARSWWRGRRRSPHKSLIFLVRWRVRNYSKLAPSRLGNRCRSLRVSKKGCLISSWILSVGEVFGKPVGDYSPRMVRYEPETLIHKAQLTIY